MLKEIPHNVSDLQHRLCQKLDDDFPEPDNPVITINSPRGISREIFLRLCVRAPFIEILSIYLKNFYPADLFRVKLK